MYNKSALKKYYSSNAYHVYTCQDGDWSWIDGSDVSYQNWIPGRPVDELCAEMTTEENTLGLWNDHGCDELKGFVCKVDKGRIISIMFHISMGFIC